MTRSVTVTILVYKSILIILPFETSCGRCAKFTWDLQYLHFAHISLDFL